MTAATMIWILAVVCVVATPIFGIPYDGLKVKFGWSEAMAEIEQFFTVPRTIDDAVAANYMLLERPPGPMPDLPMYCAPGKGVCPLFAGSGFIAGLMIAFPVDAFVPAPTINLTKKYVKWQAPETEGEPAREFWTSTLFFVSEESLKAGTVPKVDPAATLQDGSLWLPNVEADTLMKIPLTEAEINNTIYKKQNCIPNMGTHYYYNMTEDLVCEDIQPWFPVSKQGVVVGSGMQMFGNLTHANTTRDWFEIVSPPRKSIELTIPLAPTCYADYAELYGYLSIHVYYIDDPWTIKCGTSDSIKPVTGSNRLLMNAVILINQLYDQLGRFLKY